MEKYLPVLQRGVIYASLTCKKYVKIVIKYRFTNGTIHYEHIPQQENVVI
jgi:hypothetical protein